MEALDLGYELSELADMFWLEEDEMERLLDEYDIIWVWEEEIKDDEIDLEQLKRDEQERDYRYEKYGVIEK